MANIFQRIGKAIMSGGNEPAPETKTDVGGGTAFTTLAELRGKAGDTAANPYGSITRWVFFALDKIAQRVAATDFNVYRYANNEVTLDDNNLMTTLLLKPNHFQSGYEFLYIVAVNLKLWGRAPIAVIRKPNTTAILGLFCMRPDLVTNITDEKGNVTGYKYSVAGFEQTFKAEDVVDVKVPSAKDPRTGASAVIAAALEIDADVSTAIWNKFLIENGAQPAGVLQTDKTLTDATFERLKTQWENRYGGAANAGKVAILEAGLKYAATSITPKEMDYIESRKFSRDTILTLLGVPVGLVISENVNKANAETAERVFAKETIEPLVTLIAIALNGQLVPSIDQALWVEPEGVVPDDADTLRADSQAATNMWQTVNETRSKYGLPPLDGGDVLYLPFGLTPTMGLKKSANGEEVKGEPIAYVEMRVNTSKKTMTAFEKRIKRNIVARGFRKHELVREVSDTIAKGLSRKADAERKAPAVECSLELKAAPQEKELGDELPPSIKADRLAYLREVGTYAKHFRGAMQTYFAEQKDEVVKNLVAQYDATKSAERKAIDPEQLFDPQANKRKLQQGLRSYYEQNIGAGATAVAGLLDTDVSDWIETPAVQAYLMNKPSALADLIDPTTMDALRATLSEGVAQGDDLTALVARVQSVYDDADGFRAETIARTEVGSAQNFGRANEMQAQGVEQRMWICAFLNSREEHMAAHGQTVGVDEPFDVGGEPLMYPQDPDGSPENTINCQCSVAPVLAQ